MSEFLAEAQVLVRPDTTAFRAQLLAQLASATKGVTVPITVVPSKGTAAATTGLARLTEVQNEIRNNALRSAGAMDELGKKTKKTTADLLGARTATSRLDAALLGLRTAVGSSAVIGLSALALGAIVAGKALRAMVSIAAQFEQELNTFQAVAEATAAEMNAVSDAALRLGADVRLPAVSAADAAIAMTELARAGLSVQDAIEGAEGVLQLATAAQISNAEAATIAANALNAFGLEGDQAVRVADNLANAANAAQGNISDFGLAFQQASAVARQVGLSLEDTTALLALLAKNGLRGSDAGTSLRVSLIKLIAPTQKAQKVIDRLGISIRDAQGNVRPDVFAQFAEATAELGPRLRDANAAIVFGTDGLRALSIAGREGAEGLRLMQFQIDQQGTAAEVAAARTKGLTGETQGLGSQMQTLGINIGKVTNPILTGFVSSLSDAVGGINRLAGAIGDAGNAAEKHAGPDSGFGKFFEGLSKGAADLNDKVGITGLRESFLGTIDGISEGGLNAAQNLRALNNQLQALQTARIGAEKGGLSDLADQFTGDIERIREEIAKLTKDTAQVGPAIAVPLRQAAAALRETIAQQSVLGRDTTHFASALRTVNLAIGDYTRAAKLGITATNSVASGFEQVDRNARAAAFSVGALTLQVTNLTRESASLGDQLLKLQSEGGTPQQQIAVLQADIQTQRQLIEEAKAGPAEGRATAIRAARQKIIADQNEIETLQAGLVSDAKSAASSAESAAREAAAARDKQFQALADLFGERQENISNQIERAGIAGNIEKQLRLNRALIASFKKERAALLARLKTLKVSNEVRKRIMEAINDAIEDTQQTILRLEQQQRDRIKEFSTPALDLRIRIAEARDNIAAQIRLRRQRLALISKELARLKNAGKKNTVEWLELKAQQAEEAAAIRDLVGETKQKNNAFAELTFEFLQKQQGFAANLLGNLIPGFATGGLVGGSGGGGGAIGGGGIISAPRGVDPVTGRPLGESGGPVTGVQKESQIASGRDDGFSRGQGQTTNELLRKIYRSLENLNGRAGHPEARYQRVSSGGAMDTM